MNVKKTKKVECPKCGGSGHYMYHWTECGNSQIDEWVDTECEMCEKSGFVDKQVIKKNKKKTYTSAPHKTVLSDIRKAVADYMESEGCSCCRDVDGHEKHAETLAKLLKVKKYKDGSGYDFQRYRSK